MAYIESHQTLARHPKTRKLARLLDASVPAAIGHLHCLWYWAMDYAQDGDLSGYDCEEIADAGMWEGDPERFYRALATAGFIDEASEQQGAVCIHGWDEYAGRLIEKRKLDAERKRAKRLGLDVERTAPSVDTPIQQTSAGRPADGAGTVPNRTQPNLTVPDQTERESAPQADAPLARPVPKPRATRLPADYPLPDELRSWIEQNTPGLDVAYEHEKFRDYYRGAGKAQTDWIATERNWFRRAYEAVPRRVTTQNGRASPPVMNRTQQLQAEIIRQREERERAKRNGNTAALGAGTG